MMPSSTCSPLAGQAWCTARARTVFRASAAPLARHARPRDQRRGRTDSCASSGDLNLVDDLRVLHELAPDVPASRLWELATVRAARALGMEDVAGSITPGKAAISRRLR